MPPARLLFIIIFVLTLIPWLLLIFQSRENEQFLQTIELKLNEERTELAELQEQIPVMSETIENLNTILSSTEDELEILVVSKNRLQSEHEREIETLNAEIESLRTRLEGATEGTMNALRQVEDASRTLERQQRNFRSVEERLARADEAMEELQADNTRLRTIVRRLGLNPDAQPRQPQEQRLPQPAQPQPELDLIPVVPAPEEQEIPPEAPTPEPSPPTEDVDEAEAIENGSEVAPEQPPGEGRRWQMPDIFQ